MQLQNLSPQFLAFAMVGGELATAPTPRPRQPLRARPHCQPNPDGVIERDCAMPRVSGVTSPGGSDQEARLNLVPK